MALPRSRSMNRGRGRGSSPVKDANVYDNPRGGAKVGGNAGSEHDYSNNNSTADMHNAVMGGYKGRDGGKAGAGEQDYGTHGTPGAAVKRYTKMGPGQYPSTPTPSSDVKNISRYKQGKPPPKGYKYPGPSGSVNSGRIPRAKASSTY